MIFRMKFEGHDNTSGVVVYIQANFFLYENLMIQILISKKAIVGNSGDY